jgi:ATP-dependent DNA helicase RecG
VAGLPQPYLRKAVLAAWRGPTCRETFPRLEHEIDQIHRASWNLREALSFLHHPTPDVALATLEDHSHPAWQRLKAEELLAQQLSQLQAQARARCPARAALQRQRAAALHAGSCWRCCLLR